jgi:tetratricopeptide (TPR) repeat protein
LCSDAVTNSLLYSNRAHVNLLLGNFRNAMLDGQDAAKADPTNVKAYYRAAKGALGLSKYDDCRSLCTQGLKLDPGNMDLQTTLKAAKEHSIAEAQRAMELAQQAQQARAPATALADILLAKPWQIGCPQFTVGTRKPRVDKAGDVYWPVLLFYPEAGMGSDTVEDWKECDAFEAHLDVMFGPKAPPLEWDAHGAYARQHIQVYYLSYAAEPLKREELIEALYGGWPEKKDQGPARYGEKAARWIRVEEGWTLGEVLRREDHVVPGVPVFFVLSAKTPFKESFLEGDIPLL